MADGRTINQIIAEWEKADFVLQPDIDTLAPKHRVHFTGPTKYLIGKDVALGNSTPGKMEWSFIVEANNITLLNNYIKLGGQMEEYIARRIIEYLNRKKESLARNAAFLRYYSGSMYQQTAVQKIISESANEQHTGIFDFGKKQPTERVERV